MVEYKIQLVDFMNFGGERMKRSTQKERNKKKKGKRENSIFVMMDNRNTRLKITTKIIYLACKILKM